MTRDSAILSPGRNCECLVPAHRVAWLVDGERYFAALADAIERAERSVLMLGWDFHSRMRLRRDGDDTELVELLERAVRRRPRLQVRMLGWDFAMIYALEREFLPLERFVRRTHRRVHFRLDDRHPAGASHHQKIVVIDDAIAFCGGLDVTVCRWDTREHRADDPRRNDPGFPGYGPFHDVQLLVDGEAARALGAIARERWRRATGRRLRAGPRKRGSREPRETWTSADTVGRREDGDPWPAGVEADLHDVEVAVARTQPAYESLPELRHVEQLYVDAIRAARDSIYLENQYLTSSAVCDALAARLGDADPPEVVVVLPRSLSGWLEKRTIGALMARVVEKLRRADHSDRLRICVPVLPGDASLTIHSKLMIVDDRLLRVGSANLSNRSMGLDTECDLAVEARPGSAASDAIARLRSSLLAEHLGSEVGAVDEALRRHGSLLRVVEALSRGDRCLAPFEPEPGDFDASLLPARAIFDPERPIEFEKLREQLVGEVGAVDEERGRVARVVRMAAAVALPVGLLAAWQLSPVAESVTPESLAAAAGALGQEPAGGLIGLAVFVGAALLLVPVVSLIVASALIFGFVEGSLIALVGSTAAAAAGYGIGRVLWRDAVRKLAGGRIDRLNAQLSRRGVLATVFVRVVPVAPFAIVNLVAGASHMRLRDFVLGTVIGMVPGIAALAFFGQQAAELARKPSPGSVASAALAVLVLIGLALLGVVSRHRLGRSDPDREGPG